MLLFEWQLVKKPLFVQVDIQYQCSANFPLKAVTMVYPWSFSTIHYFEHFVAAFLNFLLHVVLFHGAVTVVLKHFFPNNAYSLHYNGHGPCGVHDMTLLVDCCNLLDIGYGNRENAHLQVFFLFLFHSKFCKLHNPIQLNNNDGLVNAHVCCNS